MASSPSPLTGSCFPPVGWITDMISSSVPPHIFEQKRTDDAPTHPVFAQTRKMDFSRVPPALREVRAPLDVSGGAHHDGSAWSGSAAGPQILEGSVAVFLDLLTAAAALCLEVGTTRIKGREIAAQQTPRHVCPL